MTVEFVPRSTWHPQPPTSNSGATRPRLARPVPTITVHYTGAPIRARTRTDDATTYMRRLQQIASGDGKSFEYNYVIPPRTDPAAAVVWEYAGDYQAAHSAGENAVSVGVLFALGVDNHPSYPSFDRNRPTVWELLTPGMVDAYRWLCEHLINQGVVRSAVAQTPHRNMPGAATACPGNSILQQWADLTAPNPPPGGNPTMDTPDYFTLRPQPAPVWASTDGLNATQIGPEVFGARQIAPHAIRVMPAVEAARFVFHVGTHAAVVQ